MSEECYWDQKIYPKKQVIYDFAAISLSTKNYMIQKYLNLKKEETLLSLGCGLAKNLLFLSPQVKKGIGVDISPKAINTAKRAKKELKIKNIKFLCQDATKTDFKVDKIICFDLLEHLKNPQAIFFSIKRNLKKEGIALIYTNFYGKYSLEFLKEIILRKGKLKRLWLVDLPPHHLHRFKKKDIENYCQKAGLKYKLIFKNHLFSPIFNFLTSFLRTYKKKKKNQISKAPKKIIFKNKITFSQIIQYFFARLDLTFLSFLPSGGGFIILQKQ